MHRFGIEEYAFGLIFVADAEEIFLYCDLKELGGIISSNSLGVIKYLLVQCAYCCFLVASQPGMLFLFFSLYLFILIFDSDTLLCGRNGRDPSLGVGPIYFLNLAQ